jgi:hypothetical protein
MNGQGFIAATKLKPAGNSLPIERFNRAEYRVSEPRLDDSGKCSDSLQERSLQNTRERIAHCLEAKL